MVDRSHLSIHRDQVEAVMSPAYLTPTCGQLLTDALMSSQKTMELIELEVRCHMIETAVRNLRLMVFDLMQPTFNEVPPIEESYGKR